MKKKKFDLNNPATQYISTQNEHTHTHNTLIPPGETKSRRFSLLLYPSLHKKLEDMAWEQKTSINDLINTILEEYTENQSK